PLFESNNVPYQRLSVTSFYRTLPPFVLLRFERMVFVIYCGNAKALPSLLPEGQEHRFYQDASSHLQPYFVSISIVPHTKDAVTGIPHIARNRHMALLHDQATFAVY